MKKTRNVYILVGVTVLLAIGMIAMFFLTGNDNAADSSASSGKISDEEYLLLNSLEKAPEAENLIFIDEGKDCSFVAGNTALKKAVKDVADSFFDGVIVKSTALSSKSTTELTDSEKEKISSICKYFTEKSKRAYVYCSAYLSPEAFGDFSSFAHGVVIDLSDVDSSRADKLITRLKYIRATLKNRQILLISNDEALISLIDKSLYDSLFVSLDSEADAERFKNLQLSFTGSDVTVSALTKLSSYGETLQSNEALKAHYAVKDCVGIEKRAFSSYSDAKKNTDNCFGAVRTYIVGGIAPVLAFRSLSIKNYDGEEKLTTNDPLCNAEISASYLFPVYVNGKSAGILPKGVGEIRLEFVRGSNDFIFSQNGKSVSYSIEYVFDGDIIKSISPSDRIRVSAGEEIVVMVVAYSEAEVYVKLGATKYPAEKQEGMTGFTAFYAKIKMPTDQAEISSLGKFSVIATLGNETQQLDGAEISGVVLDNIPGATSALQNSPTFNIQNFNPTYMDAEQQVMPSINAAVNKATTNSYSVPYTGNQTAVVTAEYADVMPSGSQINFVPYYSPLVKGTKDFVIGETQVFDSEENEWFYYYELACGMKVSRDSVTLENSTTMPENSLNVKSVSANNGELTIRLSTTWKVPYTMDIPEQSYYSSNSESFYASEFNASAISLTFHYTTAANGEIDCSQSDIISSATWSVSSENKTATLYLPFRERGVYYGYSLTYEGDEMVITVKNRLKGLSGSVVVLDPGHGADDCGATGLSGSVKESDINILVSYQVKTFLEQQGVTVYMTRYGDDDINLEGRKIFARSVKPDLYVSIHSNASESKSSIGTSAFYYKPFSMPLATNIYNEIVSVYKSYLYAGQQELYDDIARGVKYYPFSVTRLDEFPSVLIELGFMTNDAECYMLTVPQNQQLLGQAIAKGICETLIQ